MDLKEIMNDISTTEENVEQVILIIEADFNDGDIETERTTVPYSFIENNQAMLKKAKRLSKSEILEDSGIMNMLERYMPSLEDCEPITIESIRFEYIPVIYTLEVC